MQEIVNFYLEIVTRLLNLKDGEDIPLKVVTKKATIGEQTQMFIACYCKNPKHVGVLLGRKDHQVRTKDAILKLLQQVAYYHGVHKVNLSLEDMTKFPQEEKTSG